jgi:hypothetical protein
MELGPSWEATNYLITKKFLTFYGTVSFIIFFSQEPATGLYPEPDRSSRIGIGDVQYSKQTQFSDNSFRDILVGFFSVELPAG